MNKSSRRLSRALGQYSAVAAAFLSAPAAAQVIYHDIDPDIVLNIGQSAALDLNNDGITDFRFKVTTYGTGWYFAGLAPQPPLLTNPNAFAGYTLDLGATPSIYAFPIQLDYGVVIDQNLPWIQLADMAWVSSSTTYYFYAGMVSNYYSNILGQWSNAVDKYLALRFSVNGINMHYAWVRCDVNATGTQLVVKDFAYNASPDLPIVSGLAVSGQQPQDYDSFRFWMNRDHLHVVFPQGHGQAARLNLLDVTGRIICSFQLNEQHSILNVSHLPAGIYALQLLSTEHSPLATGHCLKP
ncbi:MAG: hypothetical protein RMK52_02175 [Chitinophagales bacterium]|nr:T9SS type A sorting domain-containing protein [Chitinophagales bacterium]MDW8393031.1 hypothetical protein [Chitinophagales bacterium]